MRELLSGASIVGAVTIVIALPVIAMLAYGGLRGPLRSIAAVFLGLVALAVVLIPASLEAAHPGPFDNSGWPGIPLGLIFLGIPALVSASVLGSAAGVVYWAMRKVSGHSLTLRDPAVVRFGMVATASFALPLFSLVVWFGVSMIEVG